MKTFINTTIVAYILLIVAYLLVGLGFTSCTTTTASQLADSIIIYDKYYDATEKLLNEIDEVHDWSTEYADSGKEENIGYYHIKYLLRDTKGMTLKESYINLKRYYQESQELLLMLEEDYNWYDTVGEGDTYCEWYDITKKIQQ